jgi:glycosyltransferase involved in cell wall biosynthesis
MIDKSTLPTIGVNIIMKNEEAILPRFLESVLPIIDTYCIVDTGSTDSSREIVKNFFDSRNIKGGVFDFPKSENEDGLLNFCGWRNYALEKAKGIMDYGFLIGCDEKVILKKNFQIPYDNL